jgi:hypothetical protein
MNNINSTAWTSDRWAEFHQSLERLDEARDPSANMNDRAYVLIGACIDEGVNTVPQIIEAMTPVGFNKRHLGALLTQGRGGWFGRDAAGVVSLKPE